MPARPKHFSFTPVTQSATNLRTAAAIGGAGAITLDGALISGGVLPSQSLAYIILMTTSAADQAKTITITGTDADGDAQTETINVPNATTGYTTKAFRSISSITASAAFTGTLSLGTANATLSAYTPTIPVDVYSTYTTVAADIGGTINFTLQKCYEDIQNGVTPNWVTLQAAGTADVVVTNTGPVRAVRAQINSYTNTATLAFVVAQSTGS